MKKILSLMLLVLMVQVARAQTELTGKWQTMKKGKPQSTIEIFKGDDGLYYGKVVDLADPSRKNAVYKFDGPDKGKKIIGLVVVKNMKYSDVKMTGGTITDPQNGKTYYASLKYNAKTKECDLRGSIDKMGVLGRTEHWKRLP